MMQSRLRVVELVKRTHGCLQGVVVICHRDMHPECSALGMAAQLHVELDMCLSIM